MKVLHVGCGRAQLPDFLKAEGVEEIRLDIDERHKPDICCSMTKILADDATVDCVYSSHSIEHLFPHEAQDALCEFLRVLKGGGAVIIECPDMQKAAEAVAAGDPLRPMYRLDCGVNITAMDMLFGFSGFTRTNPYMGHKYGYTAGLLKRQMEWAGFVDVQVQSANVSAAWNLTGVGRRP